MWNKSIFLNSEFDFSVSIDGNIYDKYDYYYQDGIKVYHKGEFMRTLDINPIEYIDNQISKYKNIVNLHKYYKLNHSRNIDIYNNLVELRISIIRDISIDKIIE